MPEEPVGGSQASNILQGVGPCSEGGNSALCCLFAKCLLPSILAFDAECPSQTGWHAGLSVLDGLHPAHLKSRECVSPVIPERRRLAAWLSAACSRRQRLAAIQQGPLL